LPELPALASEALRFCSRSKDLYWKAALTSRPRVRKMPGVARGLCHNTVQPYPGLVAILSAMEPCSTYKPWHDKGTGKTYLRPDDGKCLHYCVPQSTEGEFTMN
jgi:hypothetical protein